MDHKIREIINRNGEEFHEKYFKNHRDDWNVLCASMDTIGDTALAIQCFQEQGVGNNNGERYLKLYGLLQAVSLQQDAIRFLFDIIKKSFDPTESLKKWENYSLRSWGDLRRYRNLSSGHPIENKSFEDGKIKRAMISRITISSKGFQLLISDPSAPTLDFQYVNLDELVGLYISEAKTILSDLEYFLNSYEF